MNYFWGTQPRSTYHKTMVSRVTRYLKKKCSAVNDDGQLLTESRTDAFGYNKKSKTWFLCEIKVDPSDLKNAPQQILDTKFLFPMTEHYHPGDSVAMVIAIPAKLENYLLLKKGQWFSLCNHCQMIHASIWVIEQSSIREAFNPDTNKVVSKKTPRISRAKKKAAPKKTVSKKRVALTRRTKNTKKKTTRVKAKPGKKALKPVKAKKPVAKSKKRNTSRAKTTKIRPTKKKR